MAPAARLAIALAALAAAAGLCLGAIRDGIAGTAVYAAAREMSTWSASGNEPGEATVSWLAADLERAGRATPDDANIEELLASLSLRRIDRPQFLDEALAHYQRAVQLRPSSPYSWAGIAAVDYRKGDTGRAFQAALRHAAELGPAEPEVQRIVIDYGLAVWDEATPQTRAAIEKTITGAMKHDPWETLRLAERRGRLAVACRYAGDATRVVEPGWQRLCASREDTR